MGFLEALGNAAGAIVNVAVKASEAAEANRKENRARLESLATERFNRELGIMTEEQLYTFIKDGFSSKASGDERTEILRQISETSDKIAELQIKGEGKDWYEVNKAIRTYEEKVSYLKKLLK